MNNIFDNARAAVKGLSPAYRSNIDRAAIAFKAAADFGNCRALTAKYAETRNETDRVKAVQAVEPAIAFLKAVKNQDVIWVDASYLGGAYRQYDYMHSIVTEPPRTRFTRTGAFEYHYDTMYGGSLTLADTVQAKNVSATVGGTVVKPHSDGELIYEFLAPDDGIFDHVEVIPSSSDSGLSKFSLEVSTDMGNMWKLLTDKPADGAKPIDISSQTQGKNSFLLRYRGTNNGDSAVHFVGIPTVKGKIVDAPVPTRLIRYWDGWDKKKAEVALTAGDVKIEGIGKVELPKEVVLFESEPDLSYWSGWHQYKEYYVGKGAGDNSCLRMWEEEGPGSSNILMIPTEAGARYKLNFYIHANKGQVVVYAEANWNAIHLSKTLTFESTEDFQKAELDIEIPKTGIDPERSTFTVYFTHKGKGAEFFIDDVILQKL